MSVHNRMWNLETVIIEICKLMICRVLHFDREDHNMSDQVGGSVSVALSDEKCEPTQFEHMVT